AVEFTGDGVASLSISERLTIANMTTEWGALVGIFPVDDITIEWLKKRTLFVEKRGLAGVPSDADGKGHHPRLNMERIKHLEENLPQADPDAFYAKELMLDLSSVSPHVSGPNHVKIMTPISEIAKRRIRIQKAYLVSCVNSRVEDLAAAAKVVKGKKVAAGVEFYIAAASSEVQAESERRGDWQTLLDAGAIPLPPGCGPCIGLGKGLLQDDEVGISVTNRNFKGRMGSRNAEAYLASPAVVAASAVAGYITGPDEVIAVEINGDIRSNEKLHVKTDSITIIEGFPRKISGDLIFCHQDNLNTDGIYPDDFTPVQQAGVVMENYDPEFGKIVKEGDILVGGFNFGTGSSREQAATALKYRGIRLVLAGSFSETYKRNAINNGFLAIEASELVRDLKAKFGTDKLTVSTGIKATIDFTKATLKADGKEYRLSPVGAAAQKLIVAGGLEKRVKGKS
ncbi:MAG: aconitase family protein, partial [Candidatus Zixiibacteriota bacterium]